MAPKQRPGIFGIGLFWSDWRGELLPERYRHDPGEYDRSQMDLVREAGGTCIQISLGWDRIEPRPGVFNWEQTDARVREAGERGLELYANIGNTPEWAAPDPEPGKERLPGYRTPPAEPHAAAFGRYCRAVALRYGGSIRNYTFWNEPNGCGWINSGCSNSGGFPLYTRWLKRAYTAVKEGNPEATVAAGALDYNSGVAEGWRYVQGIYDEGGRDFFDALEIHPYAPQGIHWQAIRDSRRVMLDNDDGRKPLWIGEYGWPQAAGRRASRDLRSFLDLVRREELEFITHARYLVVSDLNEGLYGLTDIELNPRPVYHAFRRIAKTMLEKGSEPPIPDYALPYEPAAGGERPAGVGTAGSGETAAGSGRARILCPSGMIEYDEQILLTLKPPRSAGRPLGVRWFVDGECQGERGDLLYYFSRRPERQTEYAISAEMRFGKRTCRASCAVTVRQFVSNRFTVLLDDPPEAVNAGRKIRLETRVLNKASHDLSFSWKIDGQVVEGARESFLEVKGGTLGCGPHTVEVACANAGRRSSDTRRIEFRA